MHVEQEIEARRTIEKFMMEHVYPRLSEEKRKAIDGYLSKGISIKGAFDFAGVKSVICIR